MTTANLLLVSLGKFILVTLWAAVVYKVNTWRQFTSFFTILCQERIHKPYGALTEDFQVTPCPKNK